MTRLSLACCALRSTLALRAATTPTQTNPSHGSRVSSFDAAGRGAGQRVDVVPEGVEIRVGVRRSVLACGSYYRRGLAPCGPPGPKLRAAWVATGWPRRQEVGAAEQAWIDLASGGDRLDIRARQ